MQELSKKYLITLAILIGLNILFGNLVDTGGRDLAGRGIEAHSPEMRRAMFTSLLFGLQFISFLLATLVAAIPYKKKYYGDKVLLFTQLIAIGMQGLFLTAALGKLFIWG
jgi:formate hydrogenlyase subunit 3/multisubunit Na+/H+ antiporter MnhD subunit